MSNINEGVVLSHGVYNIVVAKSDYQKNIFDEPINLYCIVNTITKVREWEGFFFGQAVAGVKNAQKQWNDKDMTLSALAISRPNDAKH